MATLAILYLLLAGLSHHPPELVSLIDPDSYFSSRGIQTSAQNMEAMVDAQPGSAAEEVAQLLAIRWLGEHGAVQAKSTLLKIANGHLAGDEMGFAAQHARRALALMDKNALEQPTVDRQGLKNVLGWFPKDVTFCAAIDLRVSWASKPFAPALLTSLSASSPFPWGLLTDNGQLCSFADKVGNFRLERAAVAVAPSGPGRKELRTYIRLTGLVNRERLIRCLAGTMGQCTVQEEKANGVPITALLSPGQPAVVVIGKTDLVLISAEEGDDALPELVQKLLAIRAGKKPSALGSSLVGLLGKVPENAHAFGVGDTKGWPECSANSDPNPAFDQAFAHLREDIVVHAVVNKQIDICFRGKTKNADDAQAMLAEITRLQKDYMDGLKQLLPDLSAQVLIDDLASIQATAAGADVSGRAVVSLKTAGALGDVIDKSISAIGNAMLLSAFAKVSAAFRVLVVVVGLISLTAIGAIVGLLIMRTLARKSSGNT
jgi:hypothetical protein